MNTRLKTKKIIIAMCSLAVVLALVATASFFAIFANRQKAETSITTGTIQVDLQEEFRPGGGDLPPYDPDDEDSPVRDPDAPRDPDDEDDPCLPPYTGAGAEDAVKIVKGYNSGTQPAYVRVRLFPIIETELTKDMGDWVVHGGIPVNRVYYSHDYTGWVYNDADDYWYYTKILPAGETTQEMVISNLGVDLNEAEQTLYGDDTLRVNMLVTLESSQATNGLWRQNWGIDSLPAGVEQ